MEVAKEDPHFLVQHQLEPEDDIMATLIRRG
jgi:hypothetical protein